MKSLKVKIMLCFLSISLLSGTFSQAKEGWDIWDNSETSGTNTSTLTTGNNIIRFSPVSVVDVGGGIGLGYERIFGKKRKISVVIPAHLLFKQEPNEVAGQPTKYTNFLYFTPGFKYYPYGQKRINYSFGPNFVFGYNNSSTTEVSRGGLQYLDVDDIYVSRYAMGLIFTNYVNFQITKAFNLGLDGGFGIKFYDKINYSRTGIYNNNASYESAIDALGQFSINLGYRF